MTELLKKYSAFYSLNKEETIKFRYLITNNSGDIRHGLFLMMAYKALNYDLGLLFRLVNVGVMEKSINKSVLVSLKNLAKEVIVLANYNMNSIDGIINMVQLSKTQRFSVAGISRLFILRTLQKYDVPYMTSKDLIK